MPLGKEEIRNRFESHSKTHVTAKKHDQIREAYVAFAEFLDAVLPDGDAKRLVFVNLQQASMWSNFSVAETVPLFKSKTYGVVDHEESSPDNPT